MTTEIKGWREEFTNFFTNRKTSEVRSSSVAINAVGTRHHSGAQSSNPEVTDAKVQNNPESVDTTSEEAKRGHTEGMAQKFRTPIRIVGDVRRQRKKYRGSFAVSDLGSIFVQLPLNEMAKK